MSRGGGGGRGGGGRGGRGGGRRSDISLKHDVVLLGHLSNGIGFYRFSYDGSDQAYVGVIAQDVQTIAPKAVARGQDGYLRVIYEKLGLKFQTYDQWVASGRTDSVGSKNTALSVSSLIFLSNEIAAVQRCLIVILTLIRPLR